MIVYAILIEDRHADTDVEICSEKQVAIDRARSLAKEYSRRNEDYEEHAHESWIFNATYSCEGDNVTVYERVVH